ncbi:MAG: integral membrane protein [Sphingobacteriales bacterium]|jgi:integral membrane protein
MNKALRISAFLEGISYALLLFIGVPLKYWGGNEFLVKTLGMPHGVLFIAYIILSISVYFSVKWTKKDIFFILLASIIPFGTFYVDKKYFKKL